MPAILDEFRERGMRVWAEGDRLRCSAPVGALTPELHEELRQRKQEILAFLRSAGLLANRSSGIVPLQSHGSRPPVFGTAGHNGDVFCYRALAHHLGADQPFYGLRPPGLDSDATPLERVEDLAAWFASEIRAFHPTGPYVIAGFCAGGGIAFELARQLFRDGPGPDYLALFGAPFITSYRRWSRLRRRLITQLERVARHARALATLSAQDRRAYVAERLRGRTPQPTPATEHSAALQATLVRRAAVERATFKALRSYVPGFFAGRLMLFLPCKAWVHSSEQPLRWRSLARQSEEVFGPDDCATDIMLLEPHAAVFARLFAQQAKAS